MQAVCGKIQRIGRQTISRWKNVDIKAVRDTGIINSRSPLAQNLHSRSWLCSDSSLLLHKEFSTKSCFSMPFKNASMSRVEKPFTGPIPCLSQLAELMSTKRSFSTTGNSGEYVQQDASVATSDVPRRIKFKRLDKTARHIMQIVDKEAVEEVKLKRNIPDIRPGYIVRLLVEVPENKRRVSVVKGTVIARRNAGLNTTFRLRRTVAGVGIETLYPLYSPNIKEIEVLDKKKVRRAKLYYLRDRANALK